MLSVGQAAISCRSVQRSASSAESEPAANCTKWGATSR